MCDSGSNYCWNSLVRKHNCEVEVSWNPLSLTIAYLSSVKVGQRDKIISFCFLSKSCESYNSKSSFRTLTHWLNIRDEKEFGSVHNCDFIPIQIDYRLGYDWPISACIALHMLTDCWIDDFQQFFETGIIALMSIGLHPIFVSNFTGVSENKRYTYCIRIMFENFTRISHTGVLKQSVLLLHQCLLKYIFVTHLK